MLCLLEVYQILRAHVLFYQNSFCGFIGKHNNEIGCLDNAK